MIPSILDLACSISPGTGKPWRRFTCGMNRFVLCVRSFMTAPGLCEECKALCVALRNEMETLLAERARDT